MSLINAPAYTKRPDHYYIHWPFCSKKCHYCDFVAFEQHADYQDAYAQALLKEMEFFAQETPVSIITPPKTIYMGGGTPSICSPEQTNALFSRLHELFGQAQKECTLEANPADITEEKLDLWVSCGVNRLSIGVQALDDAVLLKLNRRQRIYDVVQAMIRTPKYIKNISIDLILGLPDISEQAWEKTLAAVVDWPISHISIYFLTVHEKTPLYFKIHNGEIALLEEHNLIEQYEKTVNKLIRHGFEQYEISNFARSGKRSIHNTAYWRHKPYRAFGLGASSFTGDARFTQTSNLLEYMAAPDSHTRSFCKSSEQLTLRDLITEKIMLGLRQAGGLDEHGILEMLSENQQEKWHTAVGYLLEKKLIEKNQQQLTLTRSGFLLEQEITLMLMQE